MRFKYSTAGLMAVASTSFFIPAAQSAGEENWSSWSALEDGQRAQTLVRTRDLNPKPDGGNTRFAFEFLNKYPKPTSFQAVALVETDKGTETRSLGNWTLRSGEYTGKIGFSVTGRRIRLVRIQDFKFVDQAAHTKTTVASPKAAKPPVKVAAVRPTPQPSPTPAPATLPPVVAPQPTAIPFVASSLDSQVFANRAQIKGSYRVTPTSVEIHADEILLRRQPMPGGESSNYLYNFRVCFGFINNNGRWQRDSAHEAFIPLNQVIWTGNDIKLTHVNFSIPRQDLPSIRDRWLVFTIECKVRDIVATSYVHTDRNFFANQP